MYFVARSGSFTYLQDLALKHNDDVIVVTQDSVDSLISGTFFKTRALNAINLLVKQGRLRIVSEQEDWSSDELRKEIEGRLKPHREQRRRLVRVMATRVPASVPGPSSRPRLVIKPLTHELEAEDNEYERAVRDVMLVHQLARELETPIENICLVANDPRMVLMDRVRCTEIRSIHGYREEYGLVQQSPDTLVNNWERIEPQFNALARYDSIDGAWIAFKVFFLLIALPISVILLINHINDEIKDVFAATLKEAKAAVPTIFGIAFLLIVGIGVYAIRGHKRRLYGTFEYLFGSIVAYYAWPKSDHILLLNAWLAFGAGVYVMVRGLDNIGKTINNDNQMKWWAKLFGKEFR